MENLHHRLSVYCSCAFLPGYSKSHSANGCFLLYNVPSFPYHDYKNIRRPQSSYINRSIRSLHDADYSGISNSTPFQFDTFQLVPVTYFYPVKFKIRSQPDVSSRVNLKRQKKRPFTEQLKFILLRINSPKAITSSYIQPSIFKYRVINNMVWTLSCPLVMVQIMIKTVLLSVISAYSTSICTYIYLVIFLS